jgi:ribosomal protein L16/L10AE
MTTPTTNIEELSRKVEQVVQEHLEASRAAVTAAVQRAFGMHISAAPARARRKSRAAKSAARRTQQQVAEVGERLCQAVRTHPGRGMNELAAELELSPRELLRPMALLRRAGRVRSAGERNQTRYFPTAQGTRASA